MEANELLNISITVYKEMERGKRIIEALNISIKVYKENERSKRSIEILSEKLAKSLYLSVLGRYNNSYYY